MRAEKEVSVKVSTYKYGSSLAHLIPLHQKHPSQSHSMSRHVHLALLALLLTGLASAQDDPPPKGIIDAAAEPLLNLVRNLTRQLIRTAQGFVDSVDTQTVTVGEQVRQVAGDVGRNALGDIVDSMQFLRERVRRLHSVTRNSQAAVQRILDNDKVSVAVKTPLLPVSLLLATLEANVAALRRVTDAGAEDPADDLR